MHAIVSGGTRRTVVGRLGSLYLDAAASFAWDDPLAQSPALRSFTWSCCQNCSRGVPGTLTAEPFASAYAAAGAALAVTGTAAAPLPLGPVRCTVKFTMRGREDTARVDVQVVRDDPPAVYIRWAQPEGRQSVRWNPQTPLRLVANVTGGQTPFVYQWTATWRPNGGSARALNLTDPQVAPVGAAGPALVIADAAVPGPLPGALVAALVVDAGGTAGYAELEVVANAPPHGGRLEAVLVAAGNTSLLELRAIDWTDPDDPLRAEGLQAVLLYAFAYQDPGLNLSIDLSQSAGALPYIITAVPIVTSPANLTFTVVVSDVHGGYSSSDVIVQVPPPPPHTPIVNGPVWDAHVRATGLCCTIRGSDV